MAAKRTSRQRRRTSKRIRANSPPPLYHAVGVDERGGKVDLGTGPLARMRDTAMASWLGDPSLRSAYVVDRRGHAYLSLEPRDRKRLMSNRGGEQLDVLEHEVEHELTTAWNALNGGDTWRAQDAFAHVQALQDFATPAQRTEIRSLAAALRRAGLDAWQESVEPNVHIGAKTELAIEEGIAIVRDLRPSEQKHFMPASVWSRLRSMPPGLYRYGSGKKRENVLQRISTDLAGALANTRIAARYGGEMHWLIDNRGGYPVVVRMVDQSSHSVYRVEEYARKLERVPAMVERRRAASR